MPEHETEASLPPVLALVPGARLGDYVIEGLLGVGGMAQVFAARRLEDGHPVAIKHFPCTDPTLLFRFKREFRTLADVRHDNLISLGELTVLRDGRAYFTMERINGRPFSEWVRRDLAPGVPPNPARLRRAMRQLIMGTEHLHQAGFVHRDLKPSNVLVTAEGRVAILDFGLIRDFTHVGQTWTGAGQTLGTPNYMAPEQIGDGTIGPAADWYAVGVMLFECLTGRRPFAGSPVEVLMAKLDDARLEVGDALAGIPAQIADLCQRLLAIEASERPSAEELLECFADLQVADVVMPRTPARSAPHLGLESARRGPNFVGRLGELARLDLAYAQMRAGETVSVHLHGHAGLGKTTLVEHFLMGLESRAPHVILRGRCHERESVPYKGVDSLVDMLSLRLRHMSPLEAAAFQPRHLAPLVRLFPVLADIWPLRGRAAPEGEPRELRRLGTAALREVLTRLGDRSPLILWIDDFHWADVDSVRLLDHLLRPPDSPSLLLILGSRASELANAELWIHTQEQVGRPAHELELTPLAGELTRSLAHALAPSADPALLDSLVEQAEGSPFALVQLTRPEREPALGHPDHGIARRILSLGRASRAVISVLAVAGRPLPRSLLVEFEPDADVELDRLGRLGLVELDIDWAAIEPVQIREIALAELSPDELRRIHGQLGELLVAHGIESDAIVDHFEAAGQLERAGLLAVATADQAASALAFERAAAGYRRAIRLAPEATPTLDIDVLRQQLADQLVQLGHTSEAASLLLEVATRVPETLAHQLRGRAARMLVFGRNAEEALPLLAEQLAAVGERLPTRKLAMIAMALWNRGLVMLRGYRLEVRDKSQISARELDRVEALQTVTMALATSGHLSRAAPLVFALRSRVLRLALAAGDARNLATILSVEAMLYAAMGNAKRADALRADAERLGRSLRIPDLECELEYLHASIDWLTFRWAAAALGFARLARRIEDSSSGAGWLRAQILRSTVHLRILSGDIAEVRRRAAGERATLREIGNNIELLEYELKAALVYLYDGEFELADAALTAFFRQYEAPSFTYQHVSIARYEVELALFTEQLARGCEKVEATIAEARRHELYRAPIIRLQLEDLRVRALALALIETPGDRRLRWRLRASIRRLASSRLPMFEASAANAQAVLLELADRPEAALVARSRALDGYERAGMRAHKAATELQIAALTSDRQALERGLAYFEREAIVGWRRFVAVIAPSRSPLPS